MEGVSIEFDAADPGYPTAAILVEGGDLTIRKCELRSTGTVAAHPLAAALRVIGKSGGAGARPAPIRLEASFLERTPNSIRGEGPIELIAVDCTFVAAQTAFRIENRWGAAPASLRLAHVSIAAGESPVFRIRDAVAAIRLDDSAVAPLGARAADLIDIDTARTLDWLGRSNIYARIHNYLQVSDSSGGETIDRLDLWERTGSSAQGGGVSCFGPQNMDLARGSIGIWRSGRARRLSDRAAGRSRLRYRRKNRTGRPDCRARGPKRSNDSATGALSATAQDAIKMPKDPGPPQGSEVSPANSVVAMKGEPAPPDRVDVQGDAPPAPMPPMPPMNTSARSSAETPPNSGESIATPKTQTGESSDRQEFRRPPRARRRRLETGDDRGRERSSQSSGAAAYRRAGSNGRSVRGGVSRAGARVERSSSPPAPRLSCRRMRSTRAPAAGSSPRRGRTEIADRRSAAEPREPPPKPRRSVPRSLRSNPGHHCTWKASTL